MIKSVHKEITKNMDKLLNKFQENKLNKIWKPI